jgi:hypothetical protein
LARWALKYGVLAVGISNVITIQFILNKYRANFMLKELKFLTKLASLLLVGAIPTAASMSFLNVYFENFLLTSGPKECLTCREVKASLGHVTIATLLPGLLSWPLHYFQADIHKSYSLPNLNMIFDTKKQRSLYLYQFKRVFLKSNQGVSKRIIGCISAQFLLSSFILHMERREFKEHIEPSEIKSEELNALLASR